MTLTLDDFTMLGTTVPEPAKSDANRLYVCSAGWQPDLGLIRIYPLGRINAPSRWSVSSVSVQRNPKDSRAESWMLAGERNHETANRHFHQTGTWSATERETLLDLCSRRKIPTSIAEANERRRSLAIVEPEHLDFEIEHNADSPDSPQLRLFSDGLPEPLGAKRFPQIPRLTFTSEGARHRLMLRDWGAYEWMRKNPNRVSEIPAALHLGPKSALLVGNLNHQRNAWVVISVLNIRVAQLSLGVAV